jgi:molybdopterin/thiamine biosynthesis adenylyltransferase
MTGPWWKRLPGRLLEEENALLSLREGEVPLVRTHRWVREPDGDPRVRVTLDLASDPLEVEVRFPAHYPEGCPSVRPIPYAALSSHQFGGTGVLCLELGPDNWHPHYTAADMVRSAWRLIAQEILSTVRPTDIPSRHASDLAERVRLGDGVLLRSEEFKERLRAAEGNAEFEFVWPARNLIRVFPVAFPKGVALTDVAPALSRETRSTGFFVRLDDGAPKAVPTDPQAFRDFVSQHGHAVLTEASPAFILLRWPSGRTRGFFRLTDKVFKLVNMPMDFSTAARTPDGLRALLSTLKVGIVGLGSLGSRVALSLGRSGVRRWVLVDGDVLEGPNVCRYPAGFADVGALKVDVVKEALRDVSATEPEIARHAVDLATATNPDLHARVLEDLGTADVLIDATANPDAFGLMAMLASDNRRPLVWGEVFGGGIGGFAASAHPEDGPCPRCIRAGFLATAGSWPPAPARQAGTPYAGGDETPVVATDADVALIAAALTNRAFDLVTRESRSPAVMLLGCRRGWIFETPMQAVPVHVRSDDWSCPRCWKTATEPDADVTSQAEALFSVPAHAHDSTAT